MSKRPRLVREMKLAWRNSTGYTCPVKPFLDSVFVWFCKRWLLDNLNHGTKGISGGPWAVVTVKWTKVKNILVNI
jgi:hypothetical protein